MLQIGDTFQDGSAVFKVKKFGGADGALVGSVTWYAGTGIPENYLLCDGSTVSRTNYADLFAVIGTQYGAGNGSTTFTLPNLINRVVQGAATAGTYKAAGLPNITGAIDGFFDFQGASQAFYKYNQKEGVQATTSGRGYHTIILDASRYNSIYGASSTVQPPALTMLPIIKYI